MGRTEGESFVSDYPLGLLNDDGGPTDLAYDWRTDEKYKESCEQILKSVYPPELLSLAAPPEPDRDTVVRWFRDSARLGIGSAKNRAATYLLIAKGDPDGATKGTTPARTVSPKQSKTKSGGSKKVARQQPPTKVTDPVGHGQERRSELRVSPDLQLNIQIHISSDASVEQINAIFESMARYFRDH